MKSCPEPLQLSLFCDEAADAAASQAITAHLARCARCRASVAEERRLAAALGSLVCPDPETLARFLDEALEDELLERVAGHVLRCQPCQEVVTWTREAEAAVSERRASGRRRRRALPARRASPWAAVLGAGAAVAAAVLLVVVLRGQPSTGQLATHDPSPRPSEPAPPPPHEPRDRDPAPPPRSVPAPDAPDAPLTPRRSPDPTPVEQPDAPQPPPSASPTEQPAPPAAPDVTPPVARPSQPAETQAPATRTDEGVLIAALDDGALTLRPAQGEPQPMQGAVRVTPGGTLLAGRDGGALQIGRATCLLAGGGELACLAPAGDGTAALRLNDGELMVDAPDAALEVQAGEAAVRAAPGGARYALGLSGGSAILCVVSGEARFGSPGQAVAIQAGGVARWEKGQLRQEKRPEPVQARARELAARAELAASVDVPRGLIAMRALRAAEAGLVSTAAPALRARAAQTVMALRAAEPRLAKLAARLLPAAEAALEELLSRDPALLAGEGAAAPTLLALLDRARAANPGRSGLGEADRGSAQALAQALAARPPAELAADAEALLALRAAERVARYRTPRGAFEGDAPAEPAQALLLALLARRKEPALAGRVLSELDAALSRSPWDAPLAPARLLQAARTLALLGEETPARHQRLVAHAWAAGQDPSLALLVAQETRGLLGEKPLALPPASLLVAPAAEGWRVTFVHRPGKRLKSLHLVASWDGWKPEGIAMEARPDGSWVVTQVLPAGRHEYKLIVERDAWITDPVNPLTGPSNVNESENSVLLLD